MVPRSSIDLHLVHSQTYIEIAGGARHISVATAPASNRGVLRGPNSHLIEREWDRIHKSDWVPYARTAFLFAPGVPWVHHGSPALGEARAEVKDTAAPRRLSYVLSVRDRSRTPPATAVSAGRSVQTARRGGAKLACALPSLFFRIV